MISSLKSSLQPIIKLIATPFLWIHPNILTLLGIIPPLVIAFFMINGDYIFALFSFSLISLDFIDGAVARITGKVSAFGGFLDSTLDRIADAIIISAFGFAGIVNWYLVIGFLIISFTVSYTRSRASEAGFESGLGKLKFNVGVFQRTERIIAMFAGLLIYTLFDNFIYQDLNILEIFFIFFIILSIISLLQRIWESFRVLK